MHHFSKRNRRYLWRVLQETVWRQWKKQLWTRNERWRRNSWNHVWGTSKCNQQTQGWQVSRRKWNTSWRHQRLQRRDERNDETNLQRGHKKEQLHTWRMEDSENKSDLQERWRRGRKQLPPNLLTAIDVQAVLDNNVWKNIPNSWPISSRRSGGLQKNLPNNGSSCDVQMLEQKCQEWGIKMWTATVDFMKAFDSISHNSIWEALLSCNVDHGYVCLLVKFTKIRRHQCRQTKRVKFSISKKRLQAGRSAVQPAVQHGAAVCIKKRDPEMAKKTMNGYLLERPRTRLPDELAIRWRRDVVRNIQRDRFKASCVNSKKQQKKWDSRFTQTRRKFSAMKAAWILTQRDT